MKNLNKKLISAFILCTSLAVNAGEGVIEINHICATQLASGCFTGDDTMGYPVTIDGSAGSSYRLTSNLIIPNSNTTAVIINSPNITIDFNGFSILRSGCELASSSCISTGTGLGITSNGTMDNLTIKNGSIIGMGDIAILISGENIIVNHMKIKWNGKDGINVTNGQVTDCIIFENGRHGIAVSSESIIKNSIITANSNIGILTFGNAIVNNNVISNNGATGMNNIGTGTNRAIYRDNIITNDGSSTLVSGGINMGGNACNGVICT